MTEVSGLLQAGEASTTARALGARQRGPARNYYAALVAIAVVCGLLGVLAARQLGAPDAIDGFAPGVMVGALIYLVVARRLAILGMRRTLVSRGLSTAFPLRLQVTPEALVYDLGDIHQTAKWKAVTEVFRIRDYWIVIAQATPFFAPRRFFASEAAERGFIAQVLAHMTPEARDRSAGAADFARFE